MVVITNFPPPTEGIKHEEPNTCALVKQKDLGKGTLYIAESRLAWVSEKGEGFSLEYPSISLHAVSRDLNNFPKECLYLMISSSLEDETEAVGKNDQSSDEEDEEDDYDPVSEIRFIPENSAILDVMFKAMSECQALHPGEIISSEDEEEEEGCYDDAEEDDGEYDVGAAEEILGAGDPSDEHTVYSNGQEEEEPMDVGQFDDADPEH